jgi:hypothetical protein
VASASRWKRRTRAAASTGDFTPISSGRINFTATGRASMRWRARQISPIPPWSSFSTIQTQSQETYVRGTPVE